MIQHWDAWCNLIGSLLGLLGGFFLAYDIIGGKNGPLAGMTRSVTYIVLFGVCYTVGLGLRFGLIACLGMGIILAAEFYLDSRRTRRHRKPIPQPKALGLTFAVARSFCVSAAFASITDWKVGLLLFPLHTLGLSVLNLTGFSPADERHIDRRLELYKKQIVASVLRGLSSTLTCWIGESLAGGAFLATVPPWKLGLTLGVTSLFIGFVSPWVEERVDGMTQRWLAVTGVLLVILGFVLQALPNWVVLLG